MIVSIINSKKIYYILGIGLLFLIWGIGNIIVSNDYLVPSIASSFGALFDLFGDGHTYKVLGHTLFRLLLSLLICGFLGFFLAMFSSMNLRVRAFFKPIMVLLKTLPLVVVITLILVMLKDDSAVYYITSVVILPIIYEACLNGFDSVDPNVINAVKIDSKIGFIVYFKMLVPLAMNHIITGFIQSIGLGLKVLVMAEFLAQPKYSIGDEFIFYRDNAVKMNYVYAWSIILIAFVLFVEYIVSILKKKYSFDKI